MGLDDFEWNWDAPGFDTEPAEFSLWGGLPQQDDAWPEASVDFGGFSFTNDFEAGGDFNLDDAAWFHGLGEAGVEPSWAPVFRDPILVLSEAGSGFEVVIQDGDTIDALANSLGMRTEDLLEANADVDPTRLQIGQRVTVPGRVSQEANTDSAQRTVPASRQPALPTTELYRALGDGNLTANEIGSIRLTEEEAIAILGQQDAWEIASGPDAAVKNERRAKYVLLFGNDAWRKNIDMTYEFVKGLNPAHFLTETGIAAATGTEPVKGTRVNQGEKALQLTSYLTMMGMGAMGQRWLGRFTPRGSAPLQTERVAPSNSSASRPNYDVERWGRYGNPAVRHRAEKVSQGSVKKDANTVAEPWVNMPADVQAIRAGRAVRVGDQFLVNGRIYGVHNSSFFPVSGLGLHPLTRAEYGALGVYNKFGNTAWANKILDLRKVGQAERQKALHVWERPQ